MAEIKFDFADWQRWGAFRITVVGIVVLAILLLVGSLANIDKAHFVQKVVIWVLGSAIIGYGHSLAHSTKKNMEGETFKDLSPRAQTFFMACHAVWFALFVAAALWLSAPAQEPSASSSMTHAFATF